MTTTKIAVIRHGTTAWNKEGRAQGSSDIPLDADGIQEAHRLAKRLSEENWDLLVSSNLQRAAQTAAIIHEAIGSDIPFIQDARIREAGGGQIEGTTETDRIARWGEGWRELELDGEPIAAVVARGNAFFTDLLANHAGKNIAVVSHGAFIRHLMGDMFPKRIAEPLKNTSVTILHYASNQWDCETYNCVKHLEIIA